MPVSFAWYLGSAITPALLIIIATAVIADALNRVGRSVRIRWRWLIVPVWLLVAAVQGAGGAAVRSAVSMVAVGGVILALLIWGSIRAALTMRPQLKQDSPVPPMVDARNDEPGNAPFNHPQDRGEHEEPQGTPDELVAAREWQEDGANSYRTEREIPEDEALWPRKQVATLPTLNSAPWASLLRLPRRWKAGIVAIIILAISGAGYTLRPTNLNGRWQDETRALRLTLLAREDGVIVGQGVAGDHAVTVNGMRTGRVISLLVEGDRLMSESLDGYIVSRTEMRMRMANGQNITLHKYTRLKL